MGETVMHYHASALYRNSNATDIDEWPNTAQMASCHLNVKISGSKAKTIISLTRLKDPRAVHQTLEWAIIPLFQAHKEPQGCSCLTEHEIFHWLSLCDRFNIFNATSIFKFTNRISHSWPCRALKRSPIATLCLQTGPQLPSDMWKSPWF